MRANGIVATSSTGGTSTLTLAAVTSGAFNQSPQFTDVFGTGSAAIIVEYAVVEYTDSSLQTIKQFEQGVGFLVPATNVLTRSKINSTWVYGTGYRPNAAGSAASAVNFGTTAANIRVYCSPLAASFVPAPAFVNTTNGGAGSLADLVGLPAAHLIFGTSTFSGSTSISIYYFPFLWDRFGLVSSASIYVANAVTGGGNGNMKFGLYEDDGTGWAGNLAIGFNDVAGSDFVTTSTGLKTVTLSTPVLLKPQWYIGALAINGNPGLRSAYVTGRTPWGTVAGNIAASASYVYAYGALASTGLASSNFTISDTPPPMVMLK